MEQWEWIYVGHLPELFGSAAYTEACINSTIRGDFRQHAVAADWRIVSGAAGGDRLSADV